MTPKPVKTFIVDDDLTILILLEEIFSADAALDVTTFNDSQVALERLGEESIDLLITDLMMPRVDGLKLVDAAQSRNPNVLAVIITGYASLDTTLQAIHAGVYDYITKPFRIEEFQLVVKNAVERIHLRSHNVCLQEEVRQSNQYLERREEKVDQLSDEVRNLREELGRRRELLTNTGHQAPGRREAVVNPERISTYESNQESSGERYDREISNLEDLFSLGTLSSEEFEMARQRLKTQI